jgi:hypothetical protein
MSRLGVARAAVVVLGLLALSPVGVYVLRAGQQLGGMAFVLLLLLELLALAAVAWGLGSASRTALLGAAVASPWLLYLGTESGSWAYLVALPEYVVLAGLGWYGLRKEARQGLRWLGALVPTLAVAYALVAPFVRGY